MKKRILLVLHSLPGAGTEILVAKLAKEFQSQYETAVCCLDAKGALAESLEKRGIPVYCLNRRPGIDWNTVKGMKRVYRDFHPDIVHAHQYTPFFYAALAKRRGMKLLFTEHGRHYPDVVKTRRRLANFWLQRRADWVGAVCEFSKTRLIELEGFRRSEIEVIYNGVPLDGVDYGDVDKTRRNLGISASKSIVGFAGGLRPVKNPLLLLDVFERVYRKYPDMHLLYLGDGELLGTLEEKARALGLEHSITFAGVRYPLSPYLKIMDLFVLPSLSEGASVTLLEAMAAKVPVLATEVGGNRELIQAEVTGMLVPPNDASVMTEKIFRLKTNPSKLGEMAEKAYEMVKTRFSEDRMMKEYRKLYAKYC